MVPHLKPTPKIAAAGTTAVVAVIAAVVAAWTGIPVDVVSLVVGAAVTVLAGYLKRDHSSPPRPVTP